MSLWERLKKPSLTRVQQLLREGRAAARPSLELSRKRRLHRVAQEHLRFRHPQQRRPGTRSRRSEALMSAKGYVCEEMGAGSDCDHAAAVTASDYLERGGARHGKRVGGWATHEASYRSEP
eukprot:4829705-Amphidinium_carterae.1